MTNKFLIQLLNGLVIVFLVFLVGALLMLPFLVNRLTAYTGTVAAATELDVFLYLTGIPFFILLLMVKKLCKNVLDNQPFSDSSIKGLNLISFCAFLDFLLYAIGTMVFMRSILSLTLMVAAFMIGLVSLILSQLIKVAKEIKEENELTI